MVETEVRPKHIGSEETRVKIEVIVSSSTLVQVES